MATVTPSLRLILPSGKPEALYEFVDGEWKETTPAADVTGLLVSRLTTELNAFAIANQRGLAMGFLLFRLAPGGPARRLDVAFVNYDRLPCLVPPEDDPSAFDLVPNLAVEVNSPTKSADEIIDKVHDYFSHGVQLVWVVYPRQKVVHVHNSPEHIRVLTEKDELDGGTVVPGFKLALAQLFAPSVRRD